MSQKQSNRGNSSESKSDKGLERGCMLGFASLACLLFGYSMARHTGKAQLDEYLSAATVSGKAIAGLKNESHIRVNATIQKGHSSIHPEDFIAFRQITRMLKSKHSSTRGSLARDKEASQQPALRILVDHVELGIAKDYYIIQSKWRFTDPKSTKNYRVIQHGLKNGDEVGVEGKLQFSGAGPPMLRQASIISGNRDSFLDYYQKQMYPMYQIGMALLVLAALFGLPVIYGLSKGGLAFYRLMKMDKNRKREE